MTTHQRKISAALSKVGSTKILLYSGLTLASLAWAGNAIIGRGLRGFYDPVQITFFRWAIASFFLFLFYHKKINFLKELKKPHIIQLFLSGICGMSGYHFLQYYALSQVPVSIVSIIIGATPLGVAFLDLLLKGNKTSLTAMLAGAFGLIGVWLVCCGWSLSLISTDIPIRGVVVAVAAMLLWALYSFVSFKKIKLPLTISMFFMAFFAAVSMLPFFVYNTIRYGINIPTFFQVIQFTYLGIPASIFAYFLYNKGIELLGKTVGSQFNCLTPGFSAILAFTLLDESISISQLLGIVIVIISLNIVIINKSRPA